MKKKIMLAALLALSIAGLCGCTGEGERDPENPDGSGDIQISVDSEGKVVYDLHPEESAPDPKKTGDLIERDTKEKEIIPPKSSISKEEAEKLVDSCSFEGFYLPSKAADFEKFYYDITKRNGKDYFYLCFYKEKNSVRIYFGTDVLVACDGSEILKKDWTGTYVPCEKDSGKKDKSQEELYPGAKKSASEALFAICGLDMKKLGLKESLSDYTFETDSKLDTREGVKCYKFTPKLNYEAVTKLGSPVFVTADGTDRVLVLDQKTNKYTEIKK